MERLSIETDILIDHLEQIGYANVRVVNGMICGLHRMVFTVAVSIDMDEYTIAGRFCFDNWLFAELFLDSWDGVTMPVVGEDGCTAIKWSPRVKKTE